MTGQSQDITDDGADFSFALRIEIAKALGAWLQQGEPARDRLEQATRRVCTEAHALKATPDQVVDMLRRLFERTPVTTDGDPERRRAAWEEFTHSCISAYFNAGDDD